MISRKSTPTRNPHMRTDTVGQIANEFYRQIGQYQMAHRPASFVYVRPACLSAEDMKALAYREAK